MDIRRDDANAVHRGDLGVKFFAELNDPDGDPIRVQWAAYACTDASNVGDCDATPFAEATTADFTIDVPVLRATNTHVESLLIALDGVDALGAAARPGQQTIVPVLDGPPHLRISKTSKYKFVAGTPVELFIEYGDPDDSPDDVTIDVMVTPPSLATFTLTDLANVPQPTDPKLKQIGKVLTASEAGQWRLAIKGTSHGVETVVPDIVDVTVDQPPCLAELEPVVPPAGAQLPLIDPTLFQVLVVDDELDRFPTVGGDPFMQPTSFAWSLKRGSGARQSLTGATANAVDLDPATFTPGELLELRVEAFDRNTVGQPLPCSDDEPSCSIQTNQCKQRLTWRIEVR